MHLQSNIAKSPTAEFSRLERQKEGSREMYQAQQAAHGETGASAQRGDPAGLSTSRNFMYEKPGQGQETLSGSARIKEVVEDLTGRH